MELVQLFSVFFLLSIAIVFTGTKLSKYADYLGDITGIGKGFIGVFLLASLTSLPELITSSTAVLKIGSPELAGGNIFGSNCFNLFILIGMAIYRKSLPLIESRQHIYNSTLINIVTIFILFKAFQPEFLQAPFVDFMTLLIVGIYLLSLKVTHQTEKSEQLAQASKVKKIPFYYMKFAACGAAIVLISYYMTGIVDRISAITHWGNSFGGFLLLALATSLPELATTIASLKYDVNMALGNILGSNMFNLMILGILKLFAPSSHIFASLSQSNVLAAFLSLLLINGLVFYLYYPGRVKLFKNRWDLAPILLLILYIAGSYMVFNNSSV